MIIVAIGNLLDGLKFYGPFNDREKAVDWSKKVFGTEGHIVEVESDVMGIDDQPDCLLDNGNGNIVEKILDLCQEHGIESDVLNELQCIEDNGCRSSQM